MDISWRLKNLMALNLFLNKSNKKNPIIKISKNGTGAKNILFLLPPEPKIAQIAAYFVKRDLSKEVRLLDYIVHKDGLSFYPEDMHSNIMTFKNQDLNWTGTLSNQSIIDRINSVRYDALVDLNVEVQPALAVVIYKLKTPIKIGFKSKYSDKLYSLVIEKEVTGFVENQYRIIEKILGL